jgi:hypothetical protein
LRELTRLKSKGQFKPFVYLNGRAGSFAARSKVDQFRKAKTRKPSQKEGPARRDLPLNKLAFGLDAPELAVRVLLLLAGLVPTTLLLAWLLIGILVLLLASLAGLVLILLVLAAHSGSPLLNLAKPNSRPRSLVAQEPVIFAGLRHDHTGVARCRVRNRTQKQHIP